MKIIRLNSFISLTKEELSGRIAPVVKFQNPVSYSKKIIAFYGNSNIQQRRETNLCFYNEASQDIEPVKISTNQLDEKEILNLSLFTKQKKLDFIKVLAERLNIYNFDDFIKDKDIISHLDKLSDDTYFSNVKVIIFPFPGIDFVSAAIILDNSIIDMSSSDFYGISFKNVESIFIV